MKDPNGRFIFVKELLDDLPFTFASIYSPNSNQISFLKDTLQALDAFKSGEVLIGGDLNLVDNPTLDRTSTHKKVLKHRQQSLVSSSLYSILQAYNLMDIWRSLYPSARRFTYYSPTHLSHSCIDYLICSRSFFIIVNQLILALRLCQTTLG